ncbi:hypothetical protein ACRRTK_016333 [Alexandromys fortis]
MLTSTNVPLRGTHHGSWLGPLTHPPPCPEPQRRLRESSCVPDFHVFKQSPLRWGGLWEPAEQCSEEVGASPTGPACLSSASALSSQGHGMTGPSLVASGGTCL